MIKYIIIIPVILNCFLCKAQDTSWKKTLTTIVYELEKKYPSDTFLSGGFKLRETKDVHVFMNCTCPENELGMSKAYWAITWILHDKSNNVGDCACGDGSEARWGVRLYIDAFEFQNIEQAENEKKLVDYFVSTARNDLNPSSN